MCETGRLIKSRRTSWTEASTSFTISIYLSVQGSSGRHIRQEETFSFTQVCGGPFSRFTCCSSYKTLLLVCYLFNDMYVKIIVVSECKGQRQSATAGTTLCNDQRNSNETLCRR